MAQNPPAGSQRIVPYLIYTDAAAAVSHLVETFGFEERFRIPGPDGIVMHAELALGGELVMVASPNPEAGLVGAGDLAGRHAIVLVYVDDVDAHFERAKAAGATVVAEPSDQFYGDRVWRGTDPEGVLWTFATHVRDVDPSEFPDFGG